MSITNVTGIHPILAVWLAHKEYSAPVGPKTISVTTLLKPIRQIILSDRCKKEDPPVDVGTLIKAQIGFSLHLGIEHSWVSPNLKNTLLQLGYPQRTVDMVRINPEIPDEDHLDIYFEVRNNVNFQGWTISGQYDTVFEGEVCDNKSTSVYTYTKARKTDDYSLQGSMYRWLDSKQQHPVITKDTMKINFIFTDYSAAMSKTPDYPSQQVYTQTIKLQSLGVTQSFISQKLDQLDAYWDAPESSLPECSEEDLWRSEPVFKYYKNPAKKDRSTKNFDTYQDAHQRLSEDGFVGEIVEVKGQAKACLYCAGFAACTQKDKLILEGSLAV